MSSNEDEAAAAEVANLFTAEEEKASQSEDAMARFYHAARWIPRAISPFIVLDCVFEAATADPEYPPVNFEKNIAIYHQLLSIESSFSALLTAFQAKDENGVTGLVKCIKELSYVMREARSQDTNKVKSNILSYLPADPSTETISPPIVGTEKYKRGWNHPWTARALCPLKYLAEFDCNPTAFRKQVQEGKLKLRAKDFPSFLYPAGSIYDELQPDRDLLRGHVLIRTLRLVFTGESSMFSGHRSAARSCQAELHNMRDVTPEVVAYAACQAYVNLSSLSQWSNIDGYFHLEKFHEIITSLLADRQNEWVKETIAFLTREMPSLKRKANRAKGPLADDSEADEDDDDDPTGILALRVRRAEEARLVEGANRDGTQTHPESQEQMHNSPSVRATPFPSRSPSSHPQSQIGHDAPTSPSPTARPPLPPLPQRVVLGTPRTIQQQDPPADSMCSMNGGPHGEVEENEENEPPVIPLNASGKRSGSGRAGTGRARKRPRLRH